MSKLAELIRARQGTPANPANPANPSDDISSFSNISRGLGSSTHSVRGSHDCDQQLPLSAVQEAARQEVLARLEAHPAVNRVFVTRWEGDALIVTLGIRGVGTGELMIPADRLGRDDLKAYGELLECLATPAGRS